jgi:hypothetical protein
MASIALSVIRCIDYLAYGTIFTRAMFLPKKKGDVFFPARKAADERWGVVRGRLCPMSEIVCFPVLNFTYSHVENSPFFALDLAVSL